jgi:hypothetical protein
MEEPRAHAGAGGEVTTAPRCRRCESSDLELRPQDGVAECRVCHLVFDPARSAPPRARTEGRSGSREVEVSLVAPEGVTAVELREGGGARGQGGRPVGVRIVQRGADLDPRFLGAQVLLSALVMLPGYFPLLRLTAPLGETWSEAIGIGWMILPMLYFGLASQVNALSIEARDGELRVRSRPLPDFRGRRIAAGDLDQLYVERIRDTYRRDHEVLDFEEYRLVGLVHGRSSPVLLARGMKSAAHALFLESTLERVLGIEDRIVPAELHEKIVAMARDRGRA